MIYILKNNPTAFMFLKNQILYMSFQCTDVYGCPKLLDMLRWQNSAAAELPITASDKEQLLQLMQCVRKRMIFRQKKREGGGT